MIKLLGYSEKLTEDGISEGLCLITEIYPESLYVWVHNPQRPFSSYQTVNVAMDITIAFSYMHSLGIVHRDMKSHNVLVKKNLSTIRASICDFGLAISLQQPVVVGQFKTTAIGLSARYASPEVRSNIFI